MNLIPFSKEHVRLGEALPFGLHDARGRLLLAAGAAIAREDRLEAVLAGELYADDTESSRWRRRLSAAADTLLVHNAALKDIAAARPHADRHAPGGQARGWTEQWSELALALDAVLRDIGANAGWTQRLDALHERMLRLHERKPEAALYWLMFHGAHSTEHYCSHHALLCALVARDAARRLGWPGELVARLGLAALAMNVAMRRLQDQLAATPMPLSAEIRADIDSHAERSAQLLAAAGVADPTVIGIVRHHHDDSRGHLALHELDAIAQAARLLRRVDVYTAMLSRRHDRPPLSPVQAAREACIGIGGTPDEIGGALLKTLGLYPPGCFVALANGETGIVIARGRKANQPAVAALVGAAGTPLGVPAVRDSSERRFAVTAALAAAAVKVVPPHEQLLALR